MFSDLVLELHGLMQGLPKTPAVVESAKTTTLRKRMNKVSDPRSGIRHPTQAG